MVNIHIATHAYACVHTHVPHNIDRTSYKLPVVALTRLGIYMVNENMQ